MENSSMHDGGSEGTILGHPKGLFVLFFAEMWERFSFYGMRALLIFYLTQHWLYSDSEGGVIYGAYTSLVYLTPVLGGYLADRYLGQRKAVLFGAVLLTFGHFLMGFEGSGGQDAAALNIFWLALAFIIVGSGFLKANISVIVGQLYPRTDVRRDGAYTIFYVGINLGALLGALLCGYLGQTYGWSYGFGAAGVGMLLGLIVFAWGKPLLLGCGEPTNPKLLARRKFGLPLEWLLYGMGVLAVAVIWWMIQHQAMVGSLLSISGLILVLYVLSVATFLLPYGSFGKAPEVPVLMYIVGSVMAVTGCLIAILIPALSIKTITVPILGFAIIMGVILQQSATKTDHTRDRIFAAVLLIFGSILFWALFEQAGSSINLYTDRHVDRNLMGWDVPASMFQSINAIYIVLLGPVFAALWVWLGRKGLEPSAPAKFGLAMLQLGAGFFVLVAGAAMGGGAQTAVLFIFLLYLLHTTGELCLSPVGLSAMNRLAPVHMASLIMGTWFFASAAGNFIAGLIAAATGSERAIGEGAAQQVVLDVYSQIGWIAVAVGAFFLIVSPFVKRLMHMDTLQDDNVGDDLLGKSEVGEPQAAGIHPEVRRD